MTTETPEKVEESPRRQLNRVFRELDGLLQDGKFEEVDDILAVVDIDNLPPTVVLGYLTITIPASKELKNRHSYFLKAREVLTKKIGSERTEKLLKGRIGSTGEQ